MNESPDFRESSIWRRWTEILYRLTWIMECYFPWLFHNYGSKCTLSYFQPFHCIGPIKNKCWNIKLPIFRPITMTQQQPSNFHRNQCNCLSLFENISFHLTSAHCLAKGARRQESAASSTRKASASCWSGKLVITSQLSTNTSWMSLKRLDGEYEAKKLGSH